jgi:hypothetical protein
MGDERVKEVKDLLQSWGRTLRSQQSEIEDEMIAEATKEGTQ